MTQQNHSIPVDTALSDVSKSKLRSDFGALLHTRRFSMTGYVLGAVFMFLPLQILIIGTVIFVQPNPGVPPYSLGEKLFVIAIGIAGGGGAASLLLFKGLSRRGSVEAYEQGMRFSGPGRRESAFRYTDVKEMRRRTLANGALVSVTFILANGESNTVSVQGSKDVQMVREILARFGPIAWQADNSFRIW